MIAARFSGTAIPATCSTPTAPPSAARARISFTTDRHEQRHSVGPFVQRAHERFIDGDRRSALSDVVGDLALRERIEDDLVAQIMDAELAPQPVERMVERHDLGEPKRGEPHEPRVAAPPCDVVDELDSGAVAPVQVLRHQQQRLAVARAVEKRAYLAQHAIGGDTRELASQQVPFLRIGEPRQLQEPRWRRRTQQRYERVVRAAQVGDGLEHGKVRFARPMMLDALSSGTRDVAEAGDEVLDQGRLADTRLTGNPHDLALAAARGFPRVAKACKRFGPADERCIVECLDSGNVALDRRGDAFDGLRDEAVPTPRHGLDETRLASVVAERRAQLADGRAQYGVADELVAPDLVEQGIRGQQRSAFAHEGAQDGEWRRGKRDGVALAHQAGVRLVEIERGEADPDRIYLRLGCSVGRTSCHVGTTRASVVVRRNGPRDDLARLLAILRRGLVTCLEALYLSVGVHGGAAAGLRRAPYAPHVVRGAISNAAHDSAVLLAHGAAAFSRAKHLAIGVHHALAPSADDVSIRISNAVAGKDGAGDERGKGTRQG
jgi:hypothetical protein